jgi:hypothetical protein
MCRKALHDSGKAAGAGLIGGALGNAIHPRTRQVNGSRGSLL